MIQTILTAPLLLVKIDRVLTSPKTRAVSLSARIKEIDALVEGYYVSYYARVHKYFHYRLSDKQRADDLVQTVFLKVCTSLKRGVWDGKGDISYIFTIARNTLIDHFRHNKHVEITSDEVVEAIADTVSASDAMEQREQHEMILSSMQGLSVHEAKAVSHRFFDDMAYCTIAKKMNKTEASVRQIVHRGLKAMKLTLEPQLALLRF